MDESRFLPPSERRAIRWRNALTTVLLRIQLARRTLRAGKSAETDAHLADAER